MRAALLLGLTLALGCGPERVKHDVTIVQMSGPRPTAAPARVPVPTIASDRGQLGEVKPWIGISLEAGARGVRVRQAIDGTPGAKAGLDLGDEILSIDGTVVHEPRELISIVAARGVGTEVHLVVWRDNVLRDVDLVLEAKPEALDVMRRKVIDRPAPTGRFADAYGPYPVEDLAALRGNVVLVELGASWCGFCRSTLPRLATWQTDLGARGLRVLWVSSEDLPLVQSVEPSITEVTRARDPGGWLARAIASSALPAFILIDREGIVRHVDLGAGAKTLDSLEAKLLELLGPDAPAPPAPLPPPPPEAVPAATLTPALDMP